MGFKLESQFFLGSEFLTKFFLAKNRLRKVEHCEFDFNGGLTHCKASSNETYVYKFEFPMVAEPVENKVSQNR